MRLQRSITGLLVFAVCCIMLSGCKEKHAIKPASDEMSQYQAAEKMKSRNSYDSAVVAYHKAAEIYLIQKKYNNWLLATIGQMDCLLAKNNADGAMSLIENAISISEQQIDTTGKIYAILLHKKATIYSQERELDKAIEFFNKSIILQKRNSTNIDTSQALSYNGLAIAYLLKGRTGEALRQFEQSKSAFIASSSGNSKDYSFLLQNLGITNTYVGNYEKAENYFLDAIKSYKAVSTVDDAQLASMYVNLGRFYQMVRNDAKALQYLDDAEKLYVSLGLSNSTNAASLYLNTAVTYIYTGDYEKAQSYLNKSLQIMTARAPGNVAELQTIYLNMGYIAEKKGNLPAAKDYYLKGLAYGENLPNSVKIIRGLANVSSRMNNSKEAEKYHKLALKVSISLYGADNPETALSLLRFGDFLSTNRSSSAQKYIDEAIGIYLKKFGSKNIETANAYYYKGLSELRSKQNLKAVGELQTALQNGFSDFSSNNFLENPNIANSTININQLNAVIAKADGLFRIFRSDTTGMQYLRASAATFSLAVDMIEKLRSSYQDEESKLSLSGNENSTYRFALETHAELYRKNSTESALAKVFNFAERSKSSILLAYLRDIEAKSSIRIPAEMREKEDLFKSQIFFYTKLIYDENLKSQPDAEKIKLWNGKLFDLNRQQLELVRLIENKYPQYYKLKYDHSVISLHDAASKLDKNQALIEYALSDTLLYIFAITHDHNILISKTIDKSFTSDLEIVRQQLSGSEFLNFTQTDYENFCRTSAHLFDLLIRPVLPVIKGKDLIIIPDGELSYLSFDVLLSSLPQQNQQQYKKLPYLIRDFTVSYTPSVTTYFNEMKTSSKGNNGKVLAFAPDYSSKNAVLNEKNESNVLLKSILGKLEYNVEEVKNISKKFRSRTFTGVNATETAFKRNAPDYKVLHLAMHTLVNDQSPQFSKLIFFRDKSDTVNDGMLNASELINMSLNAEMAVLSACNTGSGKLSAGEGVMSIARDFMYAGVPGIVMTLWAVQDKSGITLMDNFYKYIGEGKSRSQALRLAKLDYLQKCDQLSAHPHFWASYVTIGKISPCYLKNTTFTILGYSLAAVCIAIASFFVFRRKH